MTETDYKDWIYYRHHSRGGVGALILIFIGVVFLLNNFGILPWTVWSYLLRLWPVILIIVGIKMTFGRGPLAVFLSTFVTLALLILTLLLILAPTYPQVDNFLNQYLPGLEEHINIPQGTPNPSSDFNNDNSNFSY